jgi:type II secretory pathway predicted ATPase ExeA
MIKYFKHWNIEAPVFTGRANSFIDLSYQKLAIEKTEMFLSSNRKSIAIVGESGLGKSSILDHLFAKLPISKYCCLSFQPGSVNTTPYELIKKIIKHLKTNVDVNCDPSQLTSHLNNELQILKKQGQNLVVFLNLGSFQRVVPDIFNEVILISDIAYKTELPLQFVISVDQKLHECQEEIIDRLHASVHLESISFEDAHEYIKQKFLQSGLDQDLFSEKNAKLVFSKAKGRLSTLNKIMEEILIELSETNRTTVDSQFVFEFFTSNKSSSRKPISNKKAPDSSSLSESIGSEVEEKGTNELGLIDSAITIEDQTENANENINNEEDITEGTNDSLIETLSLDILDPSADEREIIHEELTTDEKHPSQSLVDTEDRIELTEKSLSAIEIGKPIENSDTDGRSEFSIQVLSSLDSKNEKSSTTKSVPLAPTLINNDEDQGEIIHNVNPPFKLEDENFQFDNTNKSVTSILEVKKSGAAKKQKTKSKKGQLKDKAKEKTTSHKTPFSALLKDA